MGHVDDNDFSGEKTRFAKSLEDIERSVSLCTMCELEMRMPAAAGQPSTTFVPSLPLLDDSTSYESASSSFVADSEEKMHSDAESEVTMYIVPESEKQKLTPRQREMVPISELKEIIVPDRAATATQKTRDDDLSQSFREILEQATRAAASEFRWEYSFDLTGGALNGEETQNQSVKQIPDLPVVDNGETENFADVKASENSIRNVAATSIEAPRIYYSDIRDDEIPVKRAKMTNFRSPVTKETVKTVETVETVENAGRPRIVDICVPDAPIIFPVPNLSTNSCSNSLEIPIAPKLTKIKEWLTECQVDVEANNAPASSHQPPSVDAPASSVNSATTRGAVDEEKKRSGTKKKYRSDDKNEEEIPSRKQRRSSDNWMDIQNVFATVPREKEPLTCRINKLGPQPTANQTPRIKTIQTAITKQRNCMRSTLTRLKNLSSYMDQVRDTLLAEDDERDKEYTVVKGDKTTRKIVVSTSTQTIERSTRSMVSIGTQTEDPKATCLPPTKTANAIVKDEPEVKRSASQPPKPRMKKTSLAAVDRVTSQAHEAIFNASFDEFRRKKNN